MIFTRIFICHDLELTEETRSEVQLLKKLCQKLQAMDAEVVIYPGRASDDEFLAFFYQHLSSCQWFLLFQTVDAIQSFGVRSAVSVARMRVEQKQMQGIVRFITLSGETLDVPSAWATIPTFDATSDAQRAMEDLLLALPLKRAKIVHKSVTNSASVTVLETQSAPPVTPSEQQPLYKQPLVVRLLPRARLAATPAPDILSGSAQRDSPTTAVLSPVPPARNHAEKSSARLSRRHLWLSVVLAVALILSVSLFAIVFSLRRSSGLAQSVATASVQRIVSAQRTVTASVQGTVSAQRTATTMVQGTASAQGTATASVQATVNTSLGLYVMTTEKVPNITDPLASPSNLKWDVLTYSGGGSCAYTNGAYHASMPQKGFFASCVAEASNYHNFLYRVYMTILNGTTRDGGGLQFRGHTGTAYRLRINVNGSYDFVTPTKTLASGTSSAIKTGLGQTNLVAVAAQGSTIDIYVNGQLLVTRTDKTFSSGNIGLMAVNSSASAVNVAYSDAQVWLL